MVEHHNMSTNSVSDPTWGTGGNSIDWELIRNRGVRGGINGYTRWVDALQNLWDAQFTNEEAPVTR